MRYILFLFLVIYALWSCGANPSGPQNDEGTLSLFMSLSSPAAASFAKVSSSENLELTRIRFLIRHVKFKSADAGSLEYVTDPKVIDVPLNGGTVKVEESTVPFGKYDRVEFRLHRLDDDDPVDLSYFNHPDFKDFVQGNRYSVIIDGLVNGQSFVFRSRENATQKLFFANPLVVSESKATVAVSILVETSGWFTDSSGAFLNPADSSNEAEISDNIKDSFKIEYGYKNSSDDHRSGGY